MVTNYRYGFNGQEKDNEVNGTANAYTAMFWEYDPRLGRRWNLDPVIKPWESPYSALSNSPIIMIDPNGDADFYNQRGKMVGTDGVPDGRLFVLTNKNDIKNARNSYFGKGMKGFVALLIGAGGKGNIQLSDFKGDVVPLPSEKVRNGIGIAVNKSNEPSGDDVKGGFHEEGGIFGTTETGEERVTQAESGKYADPSKVDKAEVNPFKAANPEEQGVITTLGGTFHIHPSGEVSSTKTEGLNTETNTGNFIQPPSKVDVKLASRGGNTLNYNIVVGARDKKVYIHGTESENQPGTTYRATFPLKKFLSITQKTEKK